MRKESEVHVHITVLKITILKETIEYLQKPKGWLNCFNFLEIGLEMEMVEKHAKMRDHL